MVQGAEGVVTSPSHTGSSVPSHKGNRTIPGVTPATCLEFLQATLSISYSEQATNSMPSALRLSSVRQYQSCWRRSSGRR